MCFYQVIETRVEVWENKKYCGNPSRQASVSSAFQNSPKLPQVFLALNRNTDNMFSMSFGIKKIDIIKRKQPVYFGHQNINHQFKTN